MDDETKKALGVVMQEAISAQGEAMVSGLLLPSLITLLIDSGAVPAERVAQLMDDALLALEKRREGLDGVGMAAIDHARARIEPMLLRVRARMG